MGEIRGLLVISCLGVAALGAGVASAEKMVLNENYNALPINVVEDQRLDPYVSRVHILSQIDQNDLHGHRKFADSVIKDLRDGQLLPLVTAYHGEETLTGCKGQWLNRITLHCAILLKSAQNAAASGDKLTAAADAIRVTGVLESVRFCSFQTLLKTASQSRQAIELLESNLPDVQKLPSTVQVWFKTKPHPDASLESLQTRSNHLQAFYVARYPIEDAMYTDLDLSIKESAKLAHRFSQEEKTERVIQVANAHGFASQR